MTQFFLNILQGLGVTIGVALGSLVLAAAIGLVAALAKLSNSKVLRTVATVYTTVIRGVPDLVWMMLLFYSMQIGINDLYEWLGYKKAPQIDHFTAGVIVLGFVYGAYMAETFRSGILSVPKGQSEAAWSLGFGGLQTFKKFVFPQIVRFILPSFTNNWLVLLKATALVSIIGLTDITYRAKQVGAAARGQIDGAAMIAFAFAGLIYLIITTISLLLLRRAENKYSVGVKRSQL